LSRLSPTSAEMIQTISC